MAKPAVSRDSFRGLSAFYAAKAHHDQKREGEHCFLKLFGSAEDIPESLLQQWSDKVDLLGLETVGRTMEPRARQITDGNARDDHASDFLHTLLRDHGQKVQ
ncbi:hypothetical protein QCM77_34970 [Bradyrhizobium sp. SSUT18]|uniref:hypothetical protein n=1 Tax=Bradyrhizobium sp. SSUT18 TaxID=3040602 RepID=UPI00244B7BA4|nr:hypothetical protein [Bradyrhizobium sp. SSUT18]MDH2405081.1 hypothetical protein [Bradyrhizobium sp. SSUT18]